MANNDEEETSFKNDVMSEGMGDDQDMSSFTRKDNHHIRIHTGEKSHQCTTCDKFLSTQQRLDLHIRTHTG